MGDRSELFLMTILFHLPATNLMRDSLQNQAIAQAVANLFMARLLPNSEISEPELLSRLKLVAHLPNRNILLFP
ncbi:MAG: hypothetical protein D3908_11945 [Candidatus Electrothrix sp. AUS4]|nr:hypothetical protein [Candidatus Electrothrix sp. AUS4]